ncbi:hypothetical protein SPONL_2233 [uncultured Candidatus Thioglobus sp.]|nr:hypothetical protein SPONL_2233 [uncultured Candidatus Thioglobus sp.]
MNLKIVETKYFSKSIKRLSKKYRKLVYDYEKLVDILATENHNAIQVTENIYKIRLQNSSNPKGKSSGFRVIYFFKTKADTLYLLDIFSKNEIDNVKAHKLIEMAKSCGFMN